MDSLGDRQKMYEKVASTSLMPKVPVMLRADGKAFHTFVRGMDKPWDLRLVRLMQNTTKYLCDNVQGCVLGYVQSDEITLVLTDWRKYGSTGYFDYKIQKLVSVVASMASTYFNAHSPFDDKMAMFDCRAWNLPRHEVNNALLWRQQDASRNSVQMLSRSHFSHKEVHNKNNSQMQDMLMEKGVNWNDIHTELKRGSCVKKFDGEWLIDRQIPLFSKDTNYVNETLPDLFEDEK